MMIRDELTASTVTDLLFEEPGTSQCLVAPDGSILRVNETWSKTTGFGGDIAIGANVIDLFPETRDLMLALHERARAGHQVERAHQVQGPQGYDAWWEERIAPVPMEGGMGLLITTRPIDATEPLHLGLPPPELTWSPVLERMTEGFLAVDSEWRFTYVNGVAERVLGIRRAEVLGRSQWEVFPRVVGTQLEANYRRAAAGEVMEFENFYAPWERWFSLTCYPREGGGISVFFRDVTEHRRIEEALRANEELFRRVFEHAATGIAIFRWDGLLRSCNPAFAALLGFTEAELRQRAFPSLIHPDDLETSIERTRRLKAGEIPSFDEESRYLRKDGQTVWVHKHVRLLPDSSQTPSVMVIVIDITERRRAEQASRESEARAQARAAELQTLLDTVPAAVWIARDPRGDHIDANHYGANLLRHPPGINVSLSAPSAERPRHFQVKRGGVALSEDELPIQAAARRGLEIRDCEEELVFDDGDTLHLLGNAAPIFGADGAIQGSIGAFIDITDRKRSEEALRESKAKLDAALASMTDAVFISDQDGKFIEINEAFATFYRFASKEECARTFTEYPSFLDVFLPDGTLAPVEQWSVPRALRGETATNAEYTLRRKDTGETWIGSYSFGPIRDHAGHIVGSVVVARDVTEAKRAEEAVRNDEQRLRALADSIPQLAWTAQPDGYVNWFNRRWYEYTGTTPEQVRGWGWQRVHDPRVLPEVVRRWRTAIAAGAELELTFPLRGENGQYRRFLTRVIPWKDQRGRVVQWFGTSTDITEIIEAQEALRASDQRKNDFIGVLSHELRNPLAPIRNSIYLLEHAAPASEQATRAKEVIRRQTEHLTRLIDDLLDVTRIGRGKITLQRTRCDLRDIIRKATDDLLSVFTRAGLTLRIEYGSTGPIWIDADAIRIAQVIGNLFQNAVKFTPKGGTISVTLAQDDRAEIRIRDTGIGMDPATIDHMFEPFAQAAQPLARTTGGLGLGLALVKGLVELHGGTVEGHSKGLGQGAEFVIRLPLATEAAAQIREERLGAAGAPPREILIIEDNLDTGQSLADLLELEGHHVQIARDARSGIALAKALHPDIVLCDIGLPDMDGYEVARALRRDDAVRASRIVAVSGYAQAEDRQRAREAGFDAHIAKPADAQELMKALAADRS